MSTLDEVIHYCNETDPVGALMLKGEWGCGKTYLIKHELAKALKDTHIIVKISLFGMTSSKALRDSIRQKWFESCMPLLGSVEKARDRTGGIFRALNRAIRAVNPLAGTAAEVMVSMDALDFVPIKSVVEDFQTHTKKRVILVYDDVERVKMDPLEMLGVINDFCENHNFNSILLANEEALKKKLEGDIVAYNMLREKTVSQAVYLIPDYDSIINSIISNRKWPSKEYADFLAEHEDTVLDVFTSNEDDAEIALGRLERDKNHNFRILTKGLDSFHRIFYHIEKEGYETSDDNLYSFLALLLTARGGIHKGGALTMEFDDNDIKQLYTKFSPEAITKSERIWIASGIWDTDAYLKELHARHQDFQA